MVLSLIAIDLRLNHFIVCLFLVNFASSCPNTERLLHRIITLPTHEGLREADIKKIIETVKNITL